MFVALSMGGKAAVNFSLTYPQKTKALVLADVAIDGSRNVISKKDFWRTFMPSSGIKYFKDLYFP